jgi:hypothetical protein
LDQGVVFDSRLAGGKENSVNGIAVLIPKFLSRLFRHQGEPFLKNLLCPIVMGLYDQECGGRLGRLIGLPASDPYRDIQGLCTHPEIIGTPSGGISFHYISINHSDGKTVVTARKAHAFRPNERGIQAISAVV